MSDDAKNALRRRMRRMRAGLSPAELDRAARAVVAPTLQTLEAWGVDSVCIYVSVRRELPTGPLLDACFARGWQVTVPFIESATTMSARRLEAGQALVPGPFGVPTSEGPVVSEPSAVLCPGLAFDREGRRLGYGGGYYDRFLSEHPAMRRLGLCIDAALVDRVPTGAHDVRMHTVVTPSGRFGPR